MAANDYGKTREGVPYSAFLKVAAPWGRGDLSAAASGYSISGFAIAVRVSGLLARAGYARRRDQRERHQKDGSGNVSEVAVAQVFGDELDRDQRQDCVAQPRQFHASPMRAAKRKRQSRRAQSQRANERQMMRAGNYL